MKKRRITTKSIRKAKTKKACGPKCMQKPLLQDPVVKLSIWASLAVIFIVAVVLLV